MFFQRLLEAFLRLYQFGDGLGQGYNLTRKDSCPKLVAPFRVLVNQAQKVSNIFNLKRHNIHLASILSRIRFGVESHVYIFFL